MRSCDYTAACDHREGRAGLDPEGRGGHALPTAERPRTREGAHAPRAEPAVPATWLKEKERRTVALS